MERRSVADGSLGITLALLVLIGAGCAPAGRSVATIDRRPAPLLHYVFFQLRDDARIPELIDDCSARLSDLPGVRSFHCGRHFDIGRMNVDAAYDVALLVGFEDEAAYRAYLAHPAHVALVETWKPQWEWIRIHDVLDPTPH